MECSRARGQRRPRATLGLGVARSSPVGLGCLWAGSDVPALLAVPSEALEWLPPAWAFPALLQRKPSPAPRGRRPAPGDVAHWRVRSPVWAGRSAVTGFPGARGADPKLGGSKPRRVAPRIAHTIPSVGKTPRLWGHAWGTKGLAPCAPCQAQGPNAETQFTGPKGHLTGRRWAFPTLPPPRQPVASYHTTTLAREGGGQWWRLRPGARRGRAGVNATGALSCLRRRRSVQGDQTQPNTIRVHQSHARRRASVHVRLRACSHHRGHA